MYKPRLVYFTVLQTNRWLFTSTTSSALLALLSALQTEKESIPLALIPIQRFNSNRTPTVSQKTPEEGVNVIYVPCHWFSCFCPFGKVTVNVLDIIVRELLPFKLLCLPPHLIDCHL